MKEKISAFMVQHKIWSLVILLVALGIILPDGLLIVLFSVSFLAVLVLPIIFLYRRFSKNKNSKFSMKELTTYVLLIFGVFTVFAIAKVPNQKETATSHTSKTTQKLKNKKSSSKIATTKHKTAKKEIKQSTTKATNKNKKHKSSVPKNHPIKHSAEKEFWKLDGQDFAKDLSTNLPKKYSGAVIAKATSNGPEDIEVTMRQSAVKQYSDQETQLMGQAIVQDVGVIFRRHMPYINKMNLADITILDQQGNAIGTGNTDGDYEPAD